MFTVGMYVSCPIMKDGDTIYVLGQITEYYERTNEVTVRFHDKEKHNDFLNVISDNSRLYAGYEVKRTNAKCPMVAVWNGIRVNVICELDSVKNSLKTYCCQYIVNGVSRVMRISEEDLRIDFYHIENDVRNEVYNFSNSDIDIFFTRQYLSKRKACMDSYEDIVSTLINTRVNLYPHQIDAVIRATRNNTTRIMLADEVGLGKTIEALTVLKYYKQKNPKFRCLIVTPSSLEYQWSNEINDRFDIDAETFSYNKVIYKKTKASVFIISYGEYYRYRYELDEMKWDMLIIDEAHKILRSNYYPALMKASRLTRNVLLLSATPIVHDGIEYLQLMKMLNPGRYKNMNIEEFKQLMKLQNMVRDRLFDLNNDIEFYDQMDMTEVFVMSLQDLNEELQDKYLANVINAISAEAEDKGLYVVRLALEYLRRYYLIESNVVRHRRIDIKEAQIERKLNKVEVYEMEGADVGVYESTLYDSLLSVVGKLISKENKYSLIRVLEAMHSSPYALKSEFIQFENWGEDRRQCFDLINKWGAYCDSEISRLINGEKRNSTRFGCLLDIIESCDARKILIFSDFKQTTDKIASLIRGRYGKDSYAVFDSSMSRLDTQLAARKFQNENGCRFIICDKSGGEGRNFQIADFIIHFDMSWSPAMMEQRIGRLDRIGRDVSRDVESAVIIAGNTIENNIFDLYNDTLKVFSRSLCGLEIIFEELQEMIANSFVVDTMFGLSHVRGEIEALVNQMEENVERELYFASSNESDAKEQSYINEVSQAFEKEIESEVENKALCWLEKFGVQVTDIDASGLVHLDFSNISQKEIRKSMFYEAQNAASYDGTFRREYAVRHDSVEYFAPNHEIYSLVMSLVDKYQLGRLLAVSMTDEKVRWAGFVLVWNVELDKTRMFKGGLNPQRYRHIRKYLSEQQVTNSFRIYGNKDISGNELMSMFDFKKYTIIDRIQDTICYENLYDEDSWEHFVDNAIQQAEVEAKILVHSWLREKELQEYLCKDHLNQEITEMTVNHFDKKLVDREKTIIASLRGCILKLDSILYIEI